MRAALALLLLAAGVTPARARGPSDFKDPFAAGAPACAQRDLARAHFATASLYYQRAKYEEAISELEQAHTLCPRGALRFDQARAYERLERWDEAAARYRDYLAEGPVGRDAGKVRARAAALDGRLRRESPLRELCDPFGDGADCTKSARPLPARPRPSPPPPARPLKVRNLTDPFADGPASASRGDACGCDLKSPFDCRPCPSPSPPAPGQRLRDLPDPFAEPRDGGAR